MNEKSAAEKERFQEGGWSAHSILIVCTLLYMVNYMDRQVFAAVAEPMRLDLGLNDSQMGTLHTVFLLSMAVFSFPAAYMVDRWSRRKAIFVMAFIWSGFTYLTGMGKSFMGVLLPRSVVGAGEAGFSSGGIAMISAAYPLSARGRVMGIFNAAIPLGAGIGMILGGRISEDYGGWQTPFFIFAIPGVILGICALFLKDYKTVVAVDETGKKSGFIESAVSLFKIPTLKWMYLGFAMQNVTAFAFLSWGPAFVQRAQGVGEKDASMTIGIIGLMALVGSPLGGIAADMWHKKNPRGKLYIPAISMFVSSILFALAILFHFEGIGKIIGIFMGITMIMGLPALTAVSQDVVSPSQKGISWGMCVFCMYALGGGWSPKIVGAVSTYMGGGLEGLKFALLLSAMGGMVGGVLYWVASRHYAQDLENVKSFVLEAE